MVDQEALTLEPNDPIRKLIVEIPDFTANPVGKKARQAMVNKVKGSTPGRHTQNFGRSEPTFVSIFFPNYSSAQYENDVASHTGLNDGWWSNFSVSVLCQSMYWQTSDLRQQLLHDKINNAVNNNNNTLRGKAISFYSHVLRSDFLKYGGDMDKARKAYIDQICTKTWVTFKMKQYNDGTWANADWEEFHHWTKLSALGATDDEITSVINRLRHLGLRIFPDVDVGTWRNYMAWYSPDKIDHLDIDSDARPGETHEVYLPSPIGMGSWMKEENSFEFTADGQPGSGYRSSPSSGSCFTATTMVLLPDSSVKEICKIKVGDKVQTPSGPRKVLLVSTPMRSGRTLYSFNKASGFKFTASHPFINGKHFSSYDPLYLSISPLNLIRSVPRIAYDGVEKLELGSSLLSYHSGSGQPFLVESIEEYPCCGPSGEMLYDLILEPDISGRFQYIVGTDQSLFVVTSEVPPFNDATFSELLGGLALLDIVDTSSLSLSKAMDVGSDLPPSRIDVLARKLSSNLLPRALSLVRNNTSRFRQIDGEEFARCVSDKMAIFITTDGAYNSGTGEMFAQLSARIFHQLSSAVQLGHRVIRAEKNFDTMAVSVIDVQVTAPLAPQSCLQDPLITVQLNDNAPVQYQINNNQLPFGIRVHKTPFFPVQKLRNEEEYRIKISIETNKEVFLASTYITLPLQLNYRHYSIPLFGGAREKGMVNFDVRCLSTADVKKESEESPTWNEEKMLSFMQHLSTSSEEVLQSIV